MTCIAGNGAARGRPGRDISILGASILALMLEACAPAGPTLVEPDGRRVAVPLACQVQPAAASSRPQPFALAFHLHNNGSAPVFTHAGCLPPFDIASCASGYADQVANRTICSCICGLGCPSCGACPPDDGAALEVGATMEWPWTATLFAREGQTQAGTECATRADLPPGRYRFSVALYATLSNATTQTASVATATADFELPSDSGVVLVETN